MKSLRMDKASKRLIVLAKNKDPDCIQIRVLIWQITLIWIQMHPVVKGGVHFWREGVHLKNQCNLTNECSVLFIKEFTLAYC